MTLLKKRLARGFTLVELMIVVAIIGILAALAIAGVRKYMTSAKSAEAKNSLGTITRQAAAAWTGEAMVATMLPDGSTIGTTHTLCATATAVPTSTDSIKGLKYQSSGKAGEDFHTTAWKCLGFSLDAPQYYQYNYTAVAGTSFAAIAKGDLNGDGTLSTFERDAVITAGEIKLNPQIIETNPDE